MKEKTNKKSGLGKVAAGAAVGVGLGILFAPKSGKETRNDIKDKVKTLTSKEYQTEFKNRVKEIEKEIKELDKEKVLNIAKKKSTELKEKTEELIIIAKEKGNKALEKTANDLKQKAIKVTKAVLEKLEEE